MLLGLWNGARVFVLWRQLTWLASLNMESSVQLLIGLSFVWALLFAGVAVAIRRGLPWSRWAVPALLLMYASSELALPWLSGSRELAPMRLLSYVVLIGISWWLLNRPPAKVYFDFHND